MNELQSFLLKKTGPESCTSQTNVCFPTERHCQLLHPLPLGNHCLCFSHTFCWLESHIPSWPGSHVGNIFCRNSVHLACSVCEGDEVWVGKELVSINQASFAQSNNHVGFYQWKFGLIGICVLFCLISSSAGSVPFQLRYLSHT